MAVALADAAFTIMDPELGAGITADLAAMINGLRLVVEVPGGTVRATAADVPATLGLGTT